MAAPVIVSFGERAFSKLSLIKNRLQSTKTDEYYNHLILLIIIEHERADNLSFENIMTARMKATKNLMF